MKKEYELKKLKRRPGLVKVDKDAAKVLISIHVDGSIARSPKKASERKNASAS